MRIQYCYCMIHTDITPQYMATKLVLVYSMTAVLVHVCIIDYPRVRPGGGAANQLKGLIYYYRTLYIGGNFTKIKSLHIY